MRGVSIDQKMKREKPSLGIVFEPQTGPNLKPDTSTPTFFSLNGGGGGGGIHFHLQPV